MAPTDFTILELILASSAILTALGIIWAKGVKPVIFGIRELLAKVKAIELVAQELVPNGGSSLRDAIDRIESSVVFLNERQKALMQDINEGVIECDSHGKITWANRTYLRKLDTTLDQISGNGWINLMHPDDVDGVVSAWSRSVTEAIDYHTHFRLRKADGTYVTVYSKAYSLKNSSGLLVGYISLINFDGEQGITLDKFTKNA